MDQVDETINGIIRDLYPEKDIDSEPSFELFSHGVVYSSDPNYWDKVRARALEIGEKAYGRLAREKQWEMENCPNVMWAQEKRLFLSNEYTPKTRAYIIDDDFGELGEAVELKLSKLNLAIFALFLDHEGVIDKDDLKDAKAELQSIYTSLGKDESKQMEENPFDEENDRRNDWFSKLVNYFNDDSFDGQADKCWHRPSHYRIRIYTRNARYEFERIEDHDYKLSIPFEVYRDPGALFAFQKEFSRRTPEIERELNLENPLVTQYLENSRIIQQRIQQNVQNGILELYAKLGEAISNKKPSAFEQWYYNDKLRRIIVSFSTKKYYLVCHGEKERLKIPSQQLALLLLFARHLEDGLTLQSIREDSTVTSELNELYHLIKGHNRKDINLVSDDSKHPNAKIMDLVSRIKKNGFEISKSAPEDIIYRLSSIHELIEIPFD